MFSLKTLRHLREVFTPRCNTMHVPVLPPPRLSKQWLKGTPRPEKMVGGGQWRCSKAQEEHIQNLLVAANVNIYRWIQYQSFQHLPSQKKKTPTKKGTTKTQVKECPAGDSNRRCLIMNIWEIKLFTRLPPVLKLFHANIFNIVISFSEEQCFPISA